MTAHPIRTKDIPDNDHIRGFETFTIKLLSIALAVAAIADALDLFRTFGLVLYKEQKLVFYLGLALSFTFLKISFSGRTKKRIPIYNWVLSIISLGCCVYVAMEYERIFEYIYEDPLDALIIGGIILLLLIEALRRTSGAVLTLFLIIFLVIGAVSYYFPTQMQGRHVPWAEYTLYLAMDSNAMLGVPMTVVSTIVTAFIFFGKILDYSNGSGFFTDISMSLMGRYRGGAAKIAVMASSIFGSISGSAVANVVSSGVVSIPLMKRGGFPSHVAGGIEAVTSTGGQLMPPMMGAAGFVMAEFLQVEYKVVVLAALIPALLYYLAMFVKVDLYAAKYKIRGLSKSVIQPTGPIFRSGWYFTLPFILIIVGLFVWNMQPHYAAMMATVSLIPIGFIVGYKKQRMPVQAIVKALIETGYSVSFLLLISAMAGVVIGVLNITGLGFALTQILVSFTGSNIVVLLTAAAFVSIILGMGMPTLGVYLLLAMLVVPAMVSLGVADVAAHMFALYFGMLSMITPPVCIAAFAASTLSQSPPMKTGLASVSFGWSAYIVPFLFVLAPELLFQGTPTAILTSTFTAALGIVFATAAFEGYLLFELGRFKRMTYGILGGVLMFPNTVGAWALTADKAAVLFGVCLVIFDIRVKRAELRLNVRRPAPDRMARGGTTDRSA